MTKSLMGKPRSDELPPLPEPQESSEDESSESQMRKVMRTEAEELGYCDENTKISGLHYLASGRGCQRLIYVDISGCEQINKDGYEALSKGCVRLSNLCLDESPNLKDEHVQALMSQCRTIRSFSAMQSPLLTDMAVKYLCLSKRLQVVKLEGNSRITDGSVRSLVNYCPELRQLYLVDCQRLTDLSLKALGHCKTLVVLNVADCVRVSDTGVRYLVEGFSGPKIRELNLTNCIRVSDVSILRIAQKCSSLTYANFSYCDHVTDAGVELLGTIPSLTSVDLSGCNISDQGIAALGNNPRYRDIIISECNNITDIGVQKLVQQVRELENFDVSHCNLLTDQVIKTLAFCCRRVRTVNVAGCKLLTDASVQYLSGVCHYIESLDISGCSHISDKALRYLRKGCRNLKFLSMRNCRGISKSTAQKMAARIANVQHSQDDGLAFPLISTGTMDTMPLTA